MSVINQVLIDLEKRRASGAERGALHQHVRVMPEARDDARRLWRIALLLALLAAAAAWAVLRATGPVPPRPAQPVAPASVALPSVPAEPAGASNPSPEHAAGTPERALAARLSFELSRLPDPVPEPAARAGAKWAIPTAQVVGETPQDARPLPAPPEPARRAEASAPVAAVSAAAKPVREASAGPVVPRVEIDKRIREPTAQQLAETEYRKATALLHQGRPAEARAGFESALDRNPAHHNARQGLLGLLVESGRTAEAEQVMRDGLKVAPHQIGFAMALARLQVDRGDVRAAIATLEEASPHAQGHGDYLAFLAGLLQREGRYAEAIDQFRAALRLRPGNGLWLLGLGMSLQAIDRVPDAREAYLRARASNALSADLQAFAEQRLRQLQ